MKKQHYIKPDKNTVTLGKAYRDARVARGYTLEQVSSKCSGVTSRTCLSYVETGLMNFDHDGWISVCKAIGINYDDLRAKAGLPRLEIILKNGYTPKQSWAMFLNQLRDNRQLRETWITLSKHGYLGGYHDGKFEWYCIDYNPTFTVAVLNAIRVNGQISDMLSRICKDNVGFRAMAEPEASKQKRLRALEQAAEAVPVMPAEPATSKPAEKEEPKPTVACAERMLTADERKIVIELVRTKIGEEAGKAEDFALCSKLIHIVEVLKA